jgi:hypothetical protein
MTDANVTVNFDTSKLDELFANLDVVAKVGYTADYAAYVEFPTSYAGTSPPFQPLRDWVERKWNDLDAGLTALPLESNDDLTPGSQEHKDAVAWIVVMSIADTGTDGVFFLRRGFEAAKQAAGDFAEAYEGSNDIDAARKIFERTFDFAFSTSQDIVADEATDRGTLLQSGFVFVSRDAETTFETRGT